MVQDPEIATTDAVEMGLPDAHSMWVAKVGVTAIDFKIPFAETAATNIVTDIYDSRGNYPSSYWNPKMGGVRYIIALVVEFKTGREPMVPLAAYQEIYCIESVPFHLKSNFQELSPLTSSLYGEQKLELKSGLGFDRKSCSVLKLSCSLQTLEIEGGIDNGVWASGGYGYVTVAIENGSSRPVTGLKVQLHQIEKTYRFMEVSQEFSPTAYKKKIISTLIFKSTNGARKSGLEISGIGGKLVSWAKKETARNESKEVVQWMDIVPGENRRHVVALRLPVFQV